MPHNSSLPQGSWSSQLPYDEQADSAHPDQNAENYRYIPANSVFGYQNAERIPFPVTYPVDIRSTSRPSICVPSINSQWDQQEPYVQHSHVEFASPPTPNFHYVPSHNLPNLPTVSPHDYQQGYPNYGSPLNSSSNSQNDTVVSATPSRGSTNRRAPQPNFDVNHDSRYFLDNDSNGHLDVQETYSGATENHKNDSRVDFPQDKPNKKQSSVKGSVDTLVKAIQDKVEAAGPAERHPTEQLPTTGMNLRSGKKTILFTCDLRYCRKTFHQKSHLEIHLRAHTGDRPYQCSFPNCGRSFSQMGNLRTHERRHSGFRPFRCEYCNKTFSQRANILSHVTAVHSKSRPYLCKLDGCRKGFSQLGNMKTHQNRFHQETIHELTEKFGRLTNSEIANLDDKSRELLNYFATIYKNSNKGIRGRGKDTRVQKYNLTTSTSSPESSSSGPPSSPPHAPSTPNTKPQRRRRRAQQQPLQSQPQQPSQQQLPQPQLYMNYYPSQPQQHYQQPLAHGHHQLHQQYLQQYQQYHHPQQPFEDPYHTHQHQYHHEPNRSVSQSYIYSPQYTGPNETETRNLGPVLTNTLPHIPRVNEIVPSYAYANAVNSSHTALSPVSTPPASLTSTTSSASSTGSFFSQPEPSSPPPLLVASTSAQPNSYDPALAKRE